MLLVSDAFGGQGGIAKFNRDLIAALAAQDTLETVVALPRKCTGELGSIPRKAVFVAEAAGGKLRYVRVLCSVLLRNDFDVVVCGHINLIPLAFLAKKILGVPIVLIVHGVDAWRPTGSAVTNFLARRVDRFVAVSELTKRRFMSWTGLSIARGSVLPNCFDRGAFGPGPKRGDLLDRYGLNGKLVLMTCGRLSSREQYKGLDEVLEVLGDLTAIVPNLVYLVVGEGDDRPRLEEKARTLGLDDRVVFAGFVAEAEKVDHFRLADAYVMPGRGEGFGIVYLEAMACGIPTVGSKLDGSKDALRDGALGILVDPDDRADIKRGILEALVRPKDIPVGLDYFSFDNYAKRVGNLLRQFQPTDGRDGD